MNISSLSNLTSTFLLLASFFCVQSAPARPLNERSTEFAWVILDEQQSDSSPRRKITPKSIFISPSFGAQSCSSGYTLDANGRCIKVVKLDTSAHEQFVLQFLNQNFANYEEDYEEGEEDGVEPLPTPGPFQLNIPLNMEPLPERGEKISIIVAPTNGQFEDILKIDDKKTTASVTSQLDAPLIITKIDIHDDDDQLKSRVTATTPTATATNQHGDGATASTPGSKTDNDYTAPVAQMQQIEYEMQQQAIFFKIPTTTSRVNVKATEAPQNITISTSTSATTATGVAVAVATTATTLRAPDRATFDEALFQDFLQDMKKQVNRRFVTNTKNSQEALYSNHRNRDRWLFPRVLDSQLNSDQVQAYSHR